MKRVATFLLVAVLLPSLSALAQSPHVHTKKCLNIGGCRPSQPIYAPPTPSQPIVVPQRVDLGRLEATTEQLAGEQRYQTHIMYLQLSELQQIKLLVAMDSTKAAAKDAVQADAARDAAIRSIPPTEIPDVRTLTPTPLPDPRTVPATPIPDPRTITPTPLPDPRGIPPTPVQPASLSSTSWPAVSRRR